MSEDRKPEEDWDTYVARLEKERLEEALKAWPKYKDRKPLERESWGEERRLAFDDGTKTTAADVRVKTTTFTFKKGAKTPYMVHVTTSKSQLFLVVSGPKAGQCITDTDENYLLFNRNGRHGKDVPKCVLVHRGSLKR